MQDAVRLSRDIIKDMNRAYDQFTRDQMEYNFGLFLVVILGRTFKDVLWRNCKKDTTSLGIIVKRILDKHLEDDIRQVIIGEFANDLVHAYKFNYHAQFISFFDGPLGLVPTVGMYENRFAGIKVSDGKRTIAGVVYRKGEDITGRFFAYTPVQIAKIAIEWCENIMAEIEHEAKTQGVSLT